MNLHQLINPPPPYPELALQDAYFLKAHGLMGRVLKNKFHLSNDLKALCIEEVTKHFIRYQVFKQELNKFLNLFPNALPIKGMSLIPRLYPDPSLREVTDIDIYFPHELKDVRKYFLTNGFTIIEDKWEANNFKLNATKIIDGVEVPFEIHQKLLWDTDIEWRIEKSDSLKRLAVEDELVYLAGHLAFQHTMLSLHWLIDIALILKAPHTWDRERIDTILGQAPLKNSLSTCLWAAEKYLHVPAPAELKPYILSDPHNKLIQIFLTEDFLKKSAHDLIRYQLLKHLLKDSFMQSLRYDTLWLKHKLWK